MGSKAREKILELLMIRKSDGIMQSEICSELRLSKSTVSEILADLEKKGEIVRERIGRAYRIWHANFAPFPVKGQVRVGVLRAAEYPHVLLAAEEVNARVIVFDNALELTRSLALGSIDIGVSPLITQVLFGLLLKSLKIHAVVAYNGSGVVSRKKIEKARTFATTELSAMENNLKLFLERTGIEAVKIRYFSSAERMIAAYEQGEFDAIAVWEPYFTLLDGYKYEFREVVGEFPCCSMASNANFYSEHKQLVVEFTEKIRACLRSMSEEQAVEVVKRLGFKEIGDECIKGAIKNYRFSAEIDTEDVKYLENYGIKLTEENIRTLIVSL
ncbi:DUF7343 domain-containing protein [Archaeoglobus veneficus]|uniref:Regulatory protein MarR n=1 Tax=Archaeoglobus veneficus (strain DSM 11195 / SNP6) TaxID=693661 RepID=F2KQ17_ARCVS|nr:MarR family transcriptional regulator [Archaeoglobus veneficus]AEA47620.1 regulatory protein MarR [Archaeoglobus veneficus SNP6]